MRVLFFAPKVAEFFGAHIPRLKSVDCELILVYVHSNIDTGFPSKRIWCPKFVRALLRPLLCGLQIALLSRMYSIDLLYGLSGYLTQASLCFASFLTDVKFVIKLRGNHFEVRRIMYGKKIRNKIYDLFEKVTLRRANAVVVTSNYLRRLAFSLHIPNNRIFRVHYPVDTNLFKPTSRKSRYDIVFPARLSTEKGIKVLLESAKMLPSITFLLVGPLQSNAMDIPPNVTWVGGKNHKEMPFWINLAKIVVIPSLSEGGIPQSASEGFACGKPAILTNVTDNMEVSKYSWIVPKGNPRVLSQTIIKALSNPKMIEIKGLSARHYISNFTYEKYGLDMKTAFEYALEQS